MGMARVRGKASLAATNMRAIFGSGERSAGTGGCGAGSAGLVGRLVLGGLGFAGAVGGIGGRRFFGVGLFAAKLLGADGV